MEESKTEKVSENVEIAYYEDIAIVYFIGNFHFSSAPEFNKLNFDKYLSQYQTIILDFSKVLKYDSFLVSYVNLLQEHALLANKIIDLRAMSKELTNYYKYLSKFKNTENQKDIKSRNHLYLIIEKIGDTLKQIYFDGYDLITFIGNVVKSSTKIFYNPRSIRWEDFPNHLIQIGINALPIALLIVFLIGLITGYQGARQLKEFGADLYIADLIGVSISRELGPLMVAIIVAGRSGSAFTAEIGTMKVSEEIDALKMMGFNIVDFLVMPRILAIVIAMPILVILTDFIGITGGLIAALNTLDITVVGYFNRLHIALTFGDVISGLIKSIVFGYYITIIGCFRGLQVSGGAESVGKYTTSSVVTSIFHIILIDAVFTFLFPILGL
jgi:phospholipid/cholesterol/gamma-HCH transport system permease protein